VILGVFLQEHTKENTTPMAPTTYYALLNPVERQQRYGFG